MVKTTLKALTLGLALMSTTVFANNPPPTIKADAPNRYIVKKGDTLWAIAGKYLDKPTRWREIWATNKQIKNPHLIYPNDVLILCIIQGQTLVGVDTGEGCAGVEKQMNAPVVDTPMPEVIASSTVSYEPNIPVIPLVNIRHWLARSVVVPTQDFENTPYILASKEGNLITSVGDKVYAKGAFLTVGQRYGIYRQNEHYIDNTNGQDMGLEATQVAAGVVTAVSPTGVSTLQILESYGSEVHEGDRVFVEVDTPPPPVFYPAPAEVIRGGMIVRMLDDLRVGGKHSVVAINLGSLQGARVGHILDVYKKGKLVRDVYDNDLPVRLPNELVGQLMVFKTFDNISYGYVLEADVPLKVGDQLLPPTQ